MDRGYENHEQNQPEGAIPVGGRPARRLDGNSGPVLCIMNFMNYYIEAFKSISFRRQLWQT